MRLRQTLGTDDRRRIDAHLAMIRDVERRIVAFQSAPERPPSYSDHVRLMGELLLLAFAADVTRVATVKLGMDRSQRVYPESGVDGPFHTLSHHSQDPAKIEAFARLNAFHVRQFASFLGRLRDTQDGASDLLHQSVLLYGSPMGDSHVHGHEALPVVVAGRAGGRITGGCHVTCAPDTPMANLLLSLAHKMGAEVDHIGDSSGSITI